MSTQNSDNQATMNESFVANTLSTTCDSVIRKDLTCNKCPNLAEGDQTHATWTNCASHERRPPKKTNFLAKTQYSNQPHTAWDNAITKDQIPISWPNLCSPKQNNAKWSDLLRIDDNYLQTAHAFAKECNNPKWANSSTNHQTLPAFSTSSTNNQTHSGWVIPQQNTKPANNLRNSQQNTKIAQTFESTPPKFTKENAKHQC